MRILVQSLWIFVLFHFYSIYLCRLKLRLVMSLKFWVDAVYIINILPSYFNFCWDISVVDRDAFIFYLILIMFIVIPFIWWNKDLKLIVLKRKSGKGEWYRRSCQYFRKKSDKVERVEKGGGYSLLKCVTWYMWIFETPDLFTFILNSTVRIGDTQECILINYILSSQTSAHPTHFANM